MNTRLLRFFWQRAFGRAWVVSLVLFVTLGGLRAYGLFGGPPSARVWIMLNFLLMWFLPFIFFTKEGRQAMGLKKVEHPRWLGWSLCLGMGGALVVFGIGWVLYGRSPDNWYVSVLDSFSVGAEQMQISRFDHYSVFTRYRP